MNTIPEISQRSMLDVSPDSQPGVLIDGLSHWYGTGANRRQVLDRVNLTIKRGEVIILTGPSGCGKTTLLTLVGALRHVMEGSVRLFGQELKNASRRQLQTQRKKIGMIFQGHNLLRCLTVEQNVQMGADLLPDLSYRTRMDMARDPHRRGGARRIGRRRTARPCDGSVRGAAADLRERFEPWLARRC